MAGCRPTPPELPPLISEDRASPQGKNFLATISAGYRQTRSLNQNVPQVGKKPITWSLQSLSVGGLTRHTPFLGHDGCLGRGQRLSTPNTEDQAWHLDWRCKFRVDD
jgi:hypothetical protein